MARGDYFYKIVQRMRDNTYQIEFSGDMNISITFNVGHLTPYIKDEDEGIEDLRKMLFKREGLCRTSHTIHPPQSHQNLDSHWTYDDL